VVIIMTLLKSRFFASVFSCAFIAASSASSGAAAFISASHSRFAFS
jgi:hypothetical protein